MKNHRKHDVCLFNRRKCRKTKTINIHQQISKNCFLTENNDFFNGGEGGGDKMLMKNNKNSVHSLLYSLYK